MSEDYSFFVTAFQRSPNPFPPKRNWSVCRPQCVYTFLGEVGFLMSNVMDLSDAVEVIVLLEVLRLWVVGKCGDVTYDYLMVSWGISNRVGYG